MSSRSLNLTASKAVPGAGSAERFFQWSLYVLVVVGFTALMGTNKLDLPSLALVLPALLLRGYFLLMHKRVAISERWTTALTVLYDASCALCVRCRHFIAESARLVPVELLDCDGLYARERYGIVPWLGEELVVVSDDGDVWVGPAAFLMCLSALRGVPRRAYR